MVSPKTRVFRSTNYICVPICYRLFIFLSHDNHDDVKFYCTADLLIYSH